MSKVWTGGLLAGAILVGSMAWAQAPRYQSPYTTPAANAPALPTPAAITVNGTVVEDVIARVDDQIISRSDVERSEQQLQQEVEQQHLSTEERDQKQKDMLRDMIDQQLLLSKAKQLGLNADAEVVRRLDEIRKQNNLPDLDALEKAARQQGVNFEDFKANIKNQVLTQQVVRDEVGRKLQLTQAGEQAYFEAHKQEFQQPEQVRLSEILISTPADASEAQVAKALSKADEVAAKIKAGGSFADLAKANSGGQTAATGGDLGLWKRGGLAKVLEDQTFGLKPGESTAPIRTKQGFVILKVTEHQDAGVPTLKQVEPQVQEAMYMRAMQPALRTYLTNLRVDEYVDVKPGFVDSGASPRQTRFVNTAYAAPQPKKKTAVQKARFDRSGGANGTPAASTAGLKGLTPLPPGTPPAPLPKDVSGATPLPGTTAAIAAAKGTADTSVLAVSADAGKSRTSRRVSRNGKTVRVKREKIRYGQAPRNALPAGPTTLASGSDTGSGARSAGLTPDGARQPGTTAELTPGQALAPSETTTEVSSVSDDNPLVPKAVSNGKTRFAARDKEVRAEKEAAKQNKLKERVAATPSGPSLEERASQKTQSAPLGLNGDTAKKVKKTKVKGAAKERLQEKKIEAPQVVPIAPTVNPSLGARPEGATTPANAASDSNEKNTTLPSSTAAPGALPQGQPLSPTGSPATTPNGTPAPQPQM